jgi:hypothetical protein
MTIPANATAEQIIAELEADGFGWDISHTGRLRECRIWKWPTVVGRYRPQQAEPLASMLRGALADMANGGKNV